MEQQTTLKMLVDFAQILSAIATTGAVWISLWLARRNEKPRIVVHSNFSKFQPAADGQRRIWLSLSIVNVGLAPVRINRVEFKTHPFWTNYDWMTDHRVEIGKERLQPPVVLGGGQDAKVDFPVFFGFPPWNAMPRGNYRYRIFGTVYRWWTWRNVGFELQTNIGTIFTRVSVEEVAWFQEHVLRPYDSNTA